MQIVYISIRPHQLNETLCYVEHLMPFIDEAVVITRPTLFSEFQNPDRLKLTLINEEEFLGNKLQQFRNADDHSKKNWLLRSSIAYCDAIDDEFIMSDDDNRPITQISIEKFKKDDKYYSYYYHDTRRRRRYKSSYDKAIVHTTQLLLKLGYNTLAFSSHMPQIINKQYLKDVVQAFENEHSRGLSEWELYFNYCYKHHPEQFHPPKPFETLCWPMLPTDWLMLFKPSTYSFENFYPELYQQNGLFADLPTAFTAESFQHITEEKIARRLKQDKIYPDVVLYKNKFKRSLQLIYHFFIKSYGYLKRRLRKI